MRTIEGRQHGEGHSVSIDSAGRISGWLTAPPAVGDQVVCPMASGRVGIYELTQVDVLSDPTTFVGAVEFLHYLE